MRRPPFFQPAPRRPAIERTSPYLRPRSGIGLFMMDRDTTASRPSGASHPPAASSDDRIGLADAGKLLGASPQTLWSLVQRLGIAHERVHGPDGSATLLPADTLEVLRPLVAAPSPGPRYLARPCDRGLASPPGRVAGQHRARGLADQQRLERRITVLENAVLDARAAVAGSDESDAARARAETAEAELARLEALLARERAARKQLEGEVPRLQRELGEQESAREWLERELAHERARREELERASAEAGAELAAARSALAEERRQRELLARGLELNGAVERAVKDHADRPASALEAPGEDSLARRPVLRPLPRIDQRSA